MTLKFDPKKFDPNKVDGKKAAIKDTTQRIRIPAPKNFDPNADASDWPVTEITEPGRAIQIIGVRPPPKQQKPCLIDVLNLLDKGNEWLNLCEYARALDCFERAGRILSELPEQWLQTKADALNGRGKALSRLKRHEEAIRCFDEAIVLEQELRGNPELDVEGAKTVMNRALALTNAGRADEGTACYREALAVFRRGYEAGSDSAGRMVARTLFNLGEAHSRYDRFSEAIAAYDQALEIHHRLTAGGQPSAAEAGVWKAKSHALLRSEQFEAALATAQRAIDILEPLAAEGPVSLQFELSWALHWKGRALERLHRPFEASECQRRASELMDAFKPTGENQT